MVDLREQDVEGSRPREQLERAWEDLLHRVDRPGVERVLGGLEIRELVAQCARELRRQRREGRPGRLARVREQRSLASRLGDRGDAGSPRPSLPAEHLERLDEVGEVLDLDRAVAAQQSREGLCRADERAGVGERDARPGRRASDLQADDGLVGLGEELERARQCRWASHGLEEEADRTCLVVCREHGAEVGHVPDGLGSARNDAAEADPGPERGQRLSDGAGLRHDCDPARDE